MRTHVSLFAGIGAMDIAAEAAGYTTTACVELDPWCRSILALRFPAAQLYADVRAVGAAELGVGMELMSGGFPCQDLSSAGNGAGLEGARSGLWFEFLRLIRECRPQRVLIENVAVLKSRGLDIVLKGLAEAGYGAQWDCVPALAVGAPHLRDRIWIDARRRDMSCSVPPGAKRISPYGKMPRAGCMYVAGVRQYVYELPPQATIKMAKDAMGAEKRADGVWLTKLDCPLFPTPTVADSRNSRNSTANRTPGGAGHSGTTLCDFMRLWPTPHGMSHPNAPRAAGPSGNELGHAVNHEARLWPTATAHPRTHTPRPTHHGMQLANEVAAEEARLWPTPTAHLAGGRVGQAKRYGPGIRRSNLDDAVAHVARGPLNPDWVEGLMLLPIGWTNPDCAEPVQRDFAWVDASIPRTAASVPHRKQRLMACGNALVWPVAHDRLLQP